eukprot:1157700-Pelagomonas_calceolata.AAC.1
MLICINAPPLTQGKRLLILQIQEADTKRMIRIDDAYPEFFQATASALFLLVPLQRSIFSQCFTPSSYTAQILSHCLSCKHKVPLTLTLHAFSERRSIVLTAVLQLTSGQEVEIRLALRHDDTELLERLSDKALVGGTGRAAPLVGKQNECSSHERHSAVRGSCACSASRKESVKTGTRAFCSGYISMKLALMDACKCKCKL